MLGLRFPERGDADMLLCAVLQVRPGEEPGFVFDFSSLSLLSRLAGSCTQRPSLYSGVILS